jgi:hypothetical protein
MLLKELGLNLMAVTQSVGTIKDVRDVFAMRVYIIIVWCMECTLLGLTPFSLRPVS